MSRIIKYVLVVALIIQGVTSSAHELYDVFTNESIEISNHSEDVVARQDFIKGEFDLGFFRIKGDRYPSKDRINKQIFDLCKDFVDKEEKMIGYYRQVKERVGNYHKIENLFNLR